MLTLFDLIADFSIETMVADSNKGLAIHNDLPMFSYRFLLGMGLQQRAYTPEMQWGRPRISRSSVYSDTTHRDRRHAFDLPDATSLETSDA